jgi:LysM repeat protein
MIIRLPAQKYTTVDNKSMKHQISQFKDTFSHWAIAAITCCLLLATQSQAQSEETTRYTVVEGDTLWGIASNYLNNPWSWTDLWQQNSQIENPNLIFPGDVLIISSDSIRLIPNKRLSVNKLTPQIRATPAYAITTIESSVIMPYITQSIIVEPELLESAAYVLQGIDGKIILGKDSHIYVKGLEPSNATEYMIFKNGRVISDKTAVNLYSNSTGKVYGTEGVHLGMARMIQREGDIAELEIIKASLAIHPGDRVVPIEKPTELPRYFPRRPDTQIDSRILSIPKGLDEAGRWDVVIISGGETDGLEEGHVLQVLSVRGKIRDPITSKIVTLPEKRIGNLMVFKTYEEVSYALLMETSFAVKVGDHAITP